MTRRGIHNPARLSSAELKAAFVARQDTLAELIRTLADQVPNGPCQHMLLIGPPGSGKTMLGLRFLQAVTETPGIAEHWQPVAFHEENYELCSVADLWLNALKHLTRTTGNPRWQYAASDLVKNESNIESRAAYALAWLAEFSRVQEKRVLLFVERLDEIIEQIDDERQIHALRATLIESPTILFVGTANSVFEKIQSPSEPFYEFFRLFLLRGLGRNDVYKILQTYTDGEDITNILPSIRNDNGRLETIRRLTSGNSRMLAIACQFLVETPFGSVTEDLERLIDAQTPYFKSQIEKLPSQARRVFHSLATGWKPMLAREVAVDAQLTSTHCSAQLKQLVRRGYANEIQFSHEKRMRYQVTDRVCNLYYLLRNSRTNYSRCEDIASLLEALLGATFIRNIYREYIEEMQIYSRTRIPVYTNIIEDKMTAYNRPKWHHKLFQRVQQDFGNSARESGVSMEVTDDSIKLSRIHAQTGDEFFKNNRIRSAEASYRLSILMDARNNYAWANLALISLFKGSYDDALNAINCAIEYCWEHGTQQSRTRLVKPFIAVGSVMLMRQRYSEAEAIFRNAIELDPRNSEAWRSLAEAIFARNEIKRFLEVESAARKAAELSATPTTILLLARISSAQGRWDEALGLIERAALKYSKATNQGAVDLTDALLHATAAGYGQQVKRVMEQAELTSRLEPVWCAVRMVLGEDPGPLPVELREAAEAVKERLEQRTWGETSFDASIGSAGVDREMLP